MKFNSGRFKKGVKHPHTKEQNIKIGLALRGKPKSEKEQERLRNLRKGLTNAWRGKRRPELSGKNNVNWKGGISPLMEVIRKCFKYRQWISDVFTRDNYTCQKCYTKISPFNAHHIKMFSTIIEENNIKTLEDALLCDELWNINNGQTLCKQCHINSHKKMS